MNTYDTNIQNLTCSCPNWVKRRSVYSMNNPKRLCKHIIKKLNIANLPDSIKYFRESIEAYRERELGFRMDFNLMDMFELDYKVLYRDGEWINIFDSDGKQYGLLINDNRFLWTRSGKPKKYKEIELFFAKKEYQPVVALTEQEINKAEDILDNRYKIESDNYVVTTKERPYGIRAKDMNVEDYYDNVCATNTTISMTVQGKDYAIQRDKDMVQKELKRLLEEKKS